MKRQYVFDGPETVIPREQAQAIGKALEALAKEKGGTFKTGDVVELARKKTSALHGYFEWDDSKAAARWRKEQAGALLRHIKVTVSVKGAERVERSFLCVDIAAGVYAPRKISVRIEDHDPLGDGVHAGSAHVNEVTTEWLHLQVRSWLKQNAKAVEYQGTKYVLTDGQAAELVAFILTAAGVQMVDKKSIRSFADDGAEAN